MGDTAKLGATLKQGKPKAKKHRGIAYESDNIGVAKVSSKGVVTAVHSGSCNIYAYGQSGIQVKIKVAVTQ